MNLPPLLDAGEPLSRQEISRYSRHLLLPEFGTDGQQRLKKSKVLVIGAGGLGSPVLLYLAAAGVGTIGIAEFDIVDESNLQRQIIHGVSAIGLSKADSAKAAIHELNPNVKVQLHSERLDKSNARKIFSHYDLMVDGTDNFATRYLVNDACVLERKPYVWGSIFRFEGQASVFWEDAPGGVGLNYRDLYPEPPPPELAPSCAEGGVLGILCASIGAIMATEAIKLITGIGQSLLGRLAVYDALDMSYRFIKLRRDPHRVVITELIDYDYFCGLNNEFEEETVLSSLSPVQLKQWQDQDIPFQLIDIREKNEWDLVRLQGAQHIPQEKLLASPVVFAHAAAMPIVLYCKSGKRSRNVLQSLQKQGLTNIHQLDGGILAWIKEIEPALPSY